MKYLDSPDHRPMKRLDVIIGSRPVDDNFPTKNWMRCIIISFPALENFPLFWKYLNFCFRLQSAVRSNYHRSYGTSIWLGWGRMSTSAYQDFIPSFIFLHLRQVNHFIKKLNGHMFNGSNVDIDGLLFFPDGWQSSWFSLVTGILKSRKYFLIVLYILIHGLFDCRWNTWLGPIVLPIYFRSSFPIHRR